MTKLDETIFEETGLGKLTPDEKARLLSYVANTLQARVGMRLAAEASPRQLEEFTRLAEQKDEDKAMAWLEQSFTQFPAIVEAELAEIKAELKNIAPKALGANQ